MPDGRKTRFSYNQQGQIIQTIAPDDSRTAQIFDQLGRLTTLIDPMMRTTRYHYPDEQGERPDVITDPVGGEKHVTWSVFGQPACYTDCSGKQTRYHYNRWGQTTLTEHETGVHTVNRYDERGRLSESENAEGDITRYRYNEAGDLIAIVYPDGNDEQFQYSPRGEPVVHLQGGLTRCFGYDPAGRLIRLVNENGAETQFSYDLMNRLTLETGFDGRIRRYRYNPVGLLIQSEDAGRVTDWHDDEVDQLVRQVWQNYDAQNTCSLNPESSTSEAQYSTAWRYDVMGRLIGAEHLSQGNNVSIHYQYNAAGQVIAEQQNVSTPDGVRLWRHEVNHEYDVLGGRTVSIPDGLPPLRWQTYGSGHLLGLALGGQNLVEFERDDLHRETECRFGQHVLNRHYSAAGRLQSLQIDDSPQHPLSYRYGYDKRGQLIH